LGGSALGSELSPGGEAAQALLEMIASGNTTKALGELDPALGSPANRLKGLERVRTILKNPTVSRQYFSENSTVTTGTFGKFYSGELRIEEGDGQSYLLVYNCKEINGKLIFNKFWLVTVTEQQKAIARFNFAGRCIGDYVLALFAISISFFSIFSAIMVWKSSLRRKVLWTVACLVSIVQFSVTWTPAEFLAVPLPSVKFFQFLLLGASFIRLGTYNPYVLSVGIPVGAIFFWFAKYKAEKQVGIKKRKSA
jgi:hypothetical protein